MTKPSASLVRLVRDRAGGRCEYCHVPETPGGLPHTTDHVVARQHAGVTSPDNLALACGFCNLHKGPNIAGVDPDTGQKVFLFHPRQQVWADHFVWQGARLVGVSGEGRATIATLAMNHPDQLLLRVELLAEGQIPAPGDPRRPE